MATYFIEADGTTQGTTNNTEKQDTQNTQTVNIIKEIFKPNQGLVSSLADRAQDIEDLQNVVKLQDDELKNKLKGVTIDPENFNANNLLNKRFEIIVAIARGLQVGNFTPSLRDRIGAYFAYLGVVCVSLTGSIFDKIKGILTESLVIASLVSVVFKGFAAIVQKLLTTLPSLAILGIFAIVESSRIFRYLANAVATFPIGDLVVESNFDETLNNALDAIRKYVASKNAPNTAKLVNMMLSGLNRLKAMLVAIKTFVTTLAKNLRNNQQESVQVLTEAGLIGSIIKKILTIGGVTLALAITFKIISEATDSDILNKLADSDSILSPFFKALRDAYQKYDELINATKNDNLS